MAKFPEMNWSAKNVGEEFKLFKQRLILCMKDHDINEAEKQALKIKMSVGTEGLKRVNSSALSEADQDEQEKLWALFENQLEIRVNFRIHRLKLLRYKQKPGETIDDFVFRCR